MNKTDIDNGKPEDQASLNQTAELYFDDPSPDHKEALAEAAKGLIYHFARLYGGGFRQDDLTQTGAEGLFKAVNNYDPTTGASFSTYASHCIIGEIRHFVRKESSYYTPGSIAGLKGKVNLFIDDYLSRFGEAPSVREIAENLAVKEESVAQIMGAGLVEYDRIDTESIRSSRYRTFQLPIEDKLFLDQAMRKLNDIQKKVIYLLFYYDLTQSEVAKRLGLTQRQVSRIKEKSIETMRGETDDG
jgi:RNA polymerase sigma-B factor